MPDHQQWSAVTLPHDMAARVAHLLGRLADSESAAAIRSESPSMSAYSRRMAEEARTVQAFVVARLWTATT